MVSGLRRHPELNIQGTSAVRIPFGPAIALGTVFTLIQHALWR
jgi:hypothetical protein